MDKKEKRFSQYTAVGDSKRLVSAEKKKWFYFKFQEV